jgi:hypothetical protein
MVAMKQPYQKPAPGDAYRVTVRGLYPKWKAGSHITFRDGVLLADRIVLDYEHNETSVEGVVVETKQ